MRFDAQRRKLQDCNHIQRHTLAGGQCTDVERRSGSLNPKENEAGTAAHWHKDGIRHTHREVTQSIVGKVQLERAPDTTSRRHESKATGVIHADLFPERQ